MCHLCDCLENLFGCGQTESVNNGCDEVETTVVCGNCQCGVDSACENLCNANTANNNHNCNCCGCGCNCGCGCSRCNG